jgi:hypothetical protein
MHRYAPAREFREPRAVLIVSGSKRNAGLLVDVELM